MTLLATRVKVEVPCRSRVGRKCPAASSVLSQRNVLIHASIPMGRNRNRPKCANLPVPDPFETSLLTPYPIQKPLWEAVTHLRVKSVSNSHFPRVKADTRRNPLNEA